MNQYQLSETKIALLKPDAKREESAINGIGFSVWSAPDPEALYEKMLTDPVDLLIVDLDNTNFDCFNVIHSLYTTKNLPIITLSSPNNIINQIMAISSGADRNIQKPFNAHILLSNILAINRNRKKINIDLNIKHDNDKWVLNTHNWTLKAPDESSLKLSMREMLLMQTLASKKGEFLKKEELSKLVFKSIPYTRKPSIDRLLNQLRKKAETAFKTEFPLKTVYLVGYAFTSPCELI